MKIKKLLAVLLTLCLLLPGASLVASADNGTKTLDEVLSAAQTIDSLPYSEDVSVYLGTDFSYPSDDSTYYGKAFKFTLTEETALSISFGGTEDTFIELYAGSEGHSRIAIFNNDNLASGGESTVVSLEAGDYYLLAASYLFTDTTQRLEISKIDASSKDSLLKNGKEITSFPYEETSSITEESVYIEDEGQYGSGQYGLAYRFTIDEKKRMEISLGGADGSSVDTVMEIYKVEGGGYKHLHSIDQDVSSGGGEKFMDELEPGEYCVLGRVYLYEGPVSVHFTAEDLSSAVTVNDIIASSVSVPTLPYSETLNSDGLPLASPDQNVGDQYFYGKAYAVDLQQDEALGIKLYDESEEQDFALVIYTRAISGDYEYVHHFDTDNYYADGENVVFKADSSQTYYIVARSWGKSEFSGNFELEMAKLSTALDFTGGTVPAPSQGDLWSWNAAEKILTLKDGFDILTFGSSAIRLPAGATLAVEDGAAAKISCYSSNNDDAVYADGDLTVTMGDGAVLEVNGLEGDAIAPYGTLTVTGPENASVTPVIKCIADNDCLDAEDIILENCNFDLMCGSDGIYAERDFTAIDCNIKIVSYDQGMDLDNNDTVSKAVLTNCVLDILSRSDEAIEGDDVSLINCRSRLSAPEDDCIKCNGVGVFTCTGGSLWATGEDDIIDAVNKIVLKDVALYLESEGGSDSAIYSGNQFAEQLAIDGNFRLYDNNGQMIYQGELTDALYNGNTQLTAADGKEAAKLVSIYGVTFRDEDGSLLKDTQIVEYGSAAEAPADPVKAATNEYTYTFVGWDKAFDVVSGDLEIYATYTATPVQTEPTEPTEPDSDQDSNNDEPAGNGGQTGNPDTDGDNTSADPSTDTDTPTGGNQTGSNQTGGSQTGDTISPQTGDNSNIALWIALALISGAALMGTTLYSRRKKCSR